jgi:hypothetical protein
MLENTEGAIKNGNIDEEKQNKNTTQCVLDTTMRNTNTNKVNKNPLQTTRGKDEPNSLYVEIVTDITTRNSERNDT